MGQVKELSELSEELKKCGETLIKIYESLNSLTCTKPVTLDELRKTLASKSQSGYTEEIKKLLKKHGADKLSDVKPEEYSSLLKEAEALPERSDVNAG
ncbi:MAG: DNA ligase [Oscillospiraceae bacterium]